MAKKSDTPQAATTPTKTKTIIKSCNCSHEFQDATYGLRNRVFNVGMTGKTTCTVCGKSNK